MTKRQAPRPSPEDLALWEAVSKGVAPLKRRRASHKAERKDTHRPDVPEAKPPRPSAAPLHPSPRPDLPALAPMDRRLRTRVARGTVEIDARIDLHGLTQAAAHRRLHSFLAASQAAGAKLVLVITGKGRPGIHPMDEERGVLKRSVPLWLGSEEMRRFVIGYEAAGRSHGGEGALYVRIRSRRRTDA